MANTHVVLQGVKEYTLELIGEEYRDVAVAAADRAADEADRAEAAADTVVAGVPDGAVTRPKLAPDVVAELDSKADQGAVDAALELKADAQVMNDVLENKSDVGHKHVSDDITNTTSTVTESSTHGGKILALGTQGKLFWNREARVHNDLTNKAYVDGEVAKKADKDHTHTVEDITDLPAIESGSSTADTLVQRDANGRITIRGGTSSSHAVTRGQLNGKADASHSHTAAEVGARPDTWTPTAAQVGAATPAYVDQEVGKKADTGHTHTSEHISDATDTGGEGSGGKVVKWNSSGEIIRPGGGTPVHWESLVNRRYVDSRIQEVTADQWPSNPQPGVIYWQAED